MGGGVVSPHRSVVFFRLWWRTKVWIYGETVIFFRLFFFNFLHATQLWKQTIWIYQRYKRAILHLHVIWNFGIFLNVSYSSYTCTVCKGTDKSAKSSHNILTTQYIYESNVFLFLYQFASRRHVFSFLKTRENW